MINKKILITLCIIVSFINSSCNSSEYDSYIERITKIYTILETPMASNSLINISIDEVLILRSDILFSDLDDDERAEIDKYAENLYTLLRWERSYQCIKDRVFTNEFEFDLSTTETISLSFIDRDNIEITHSYGLNKLGAWGVLFSELSGNKSDPLPESSTTQTSVSFFERDNEYGVFIVDYTLPNNSSNKHYIIYNDESCYLDEVLWKIEID